MSSNKRVALNPLLEKGIRDELFKKQGGRCMYCGRKVGRDLLELDHKNPVTRGGTNQKSNFQLLCGSCNKRKGALNDREFRQKYRAAGVPRTQILPDRVIDQSKFVEAGKAKPTKLIIHAPGIWDGNPVCGGKGKTGLWFEEVTCQKCLNM